MEVSLAIALGLFGSAFGVSSFIICMYLLIKMQVMTVKKQEPEWEPLQTEELLENLEAGDAALYEDAGEDYKI